MSYFGSTDYLIEVSKGNVSGASLINKFGANVSLSSSYVPISINGIYQTPQASAPQTLFVRSTSASDTAGGIGAREVTIEGIAPDGSLQTASVATNGVSNSANFAGTWIRIFRIYVSASGTYATVSSQSHVGTIQLRSATSGVWGVIDNTNIAKSQSQIGAYTVPLGYTAYLLDYTVTLDSGKTVDFAFFLRENILQTSAPYSAMRLKFQEIGLAAPFTRNFPDPVKFPELTDIGFLAKGQSTPSVTVDFNILLIQN